MEKNRKSDERNRGSDDNWLLQLNLLQMDFDEIEYDMDEMREKTPPDMVDKIFGTWEGSISLPITGDVSRAFFEASSEQPVIFHCENNEISFGSNVAIAKARLWVDDKILFHTVNVGKWEKRHLVLVPQPYFLYLVENIWVAQDKWQFRNGLR